MLLKIVFSEMVGSIGANEKALKKWGIRSTHFHKPIQMIRSTNVQVTTKAPIFFNAVLQAVASTNVATKNKKKENNFSVDF